MTAVYEYDKYITTSENLNETLEKYGVEPRKGREQQNFRCVVYLCYTPRSLSSGKEIKKKIKAFEEMRMTSHWPHKVKLFPKMPNTYGAQIEDVEPLTPPEINEIGRKLVGY